MTCANNAATAAGQQLNSILASVQSCVQSGWIVFLEMRESKVTSTAFLRTLFIWNCRIVK
jgi:hypothetical protein